MGWRSEGYVHRPVTRQKMSDRPRFGLLVAMCNIDCCSKHNVDSDTPSFSVSCYRAPRKGDSLSRIGRSCSA
jgi:hypothetical protein